MNKESIQNIIDQSELLVSINNKKKVLKERLDAELTFGQSGGIFKITVELMSHVRFMTSTGKTHNVVLLDINQTPVLINNLEKFSNDIQDRYFSAISKYHAEYSKLQDMFNAKKAKVGSL